MIEAEKANHSIVWLCAKLKVSRASFYRWRNPKPPGPRAVRHAMLVEAVKTRYEAAGGKAGRDQLTLMCNNDGIEVGVATVGSIMRDEGLRAIRTQAWRKTTEADPGARTAHIENHMLDENGNRDFAASVPGTRLCGDITYLRTRQGWLYLATVIDLCTGMIIGWSMADHMKARLCVDALEMARDHGYMAAKAVFHSDRGAQYTSSEFQKWCSANGVTQSMGAVGVCWDNAVAENFFSHLKTEHYHHHSFQTRLAARTSVMEYIESWYNRQRPNRRAGGLPPATALANHQTNHNNIVAA